jgi:hypothetical protein
MRFFNSSQSAVIWTTLTLSCGIASANDIYIAKNTAGTGNGQDCANARSVTFFNTPSNWGTGSAQVGPGTTVHVCGTVTGTAGSTALTFQGSGTSGNPITLLFEPNAILQAPYFASSLGGNAAGGITFGTGLSYLVVDGGTNGVVQNTSNGSSAGNNKVASTGISGFNCSNCTIKNLTVANIFVNLTGDGSLGDNSVARGIDISGSHWTIKNNVMHDCGWCLVEFYSNGDSDAQVYANDFFHFGHAWALASTSGSATNIMFHDNKMHDTNNWDASGCPYHQDGIHLFGGPGSSISGLYISNNYFYGSWGVCPTGFVFVEGGTTNPAHLSNSYWWNNVGIIPSGSITNTNGWFGIFSGESGVTQILNNTVVGPGNSDNTACFNIGPVTNLSFKNNTISDCGDPVAIGNSNFTSGSVDYNFYGTTCGNGNNCFVWNGSFTGSFTAWRGACACDAHSVQSNTPLLDSMGSLQVGSSGIQAGANLLGIASGYLFTLSSETTLGGNVSPHLRPATGAWDVGAYQYSSSVAPPPPNPPSGLTAIAR